MAPRSTSGRLLAAYIRGLMAADGDPSSAAAFLMGQRSEQSQAAARILRAAVGASTPADLAAATKPLGIELGQLLRGESLLSGIVGARRVPLRVRIFSQASGARAAFARPGAPLPVQRGDFGAAQGLGPARLGAISVQSLELARAAPEIGDPIITGDLVLAVAAGEDARLADYTHAPDEHEPGGLAYGSPTIASSGATTAAIDADLRRMVTAVTDGGNTLRSAVWLMHSRSAAYLSTLRGSGDSPAYPGATANGGRLLGLPVLASPSVPVVGSPGASTITLVCGDAVRWADDGEANFEASRDVALQMDDAPGQNSVTGTGSSMVSMWQAGAIAIKAERFVNWALARDDAAIVLTGVSF